jgi:hypothetical protein
MLYTMLHNLRNIPVCKAICNVVWKCIFFFLWTMASLMILPHIFLSSVFFHHASTFNSFTYFKTLSSHLNLSVPFFREPSSCEKVIFLQGELSSFLTKCPSHLNLATFITLTIDRYTNCVVHNCI